MKKFKTSWDDVERFVKKVTDECGEACGVYGPPRGGLTLAVMLSHRLNVPMLMAPCDGCLIVDDICDSGDTMWHHRKTIDCKIATMFYVRESAVTHDFWMFEKKQGDWVVFPWE